MCVPLQTIVKPLKAGDSHILTVKAKRSKRLIVCHDIAQHYSALVPGILSCDIQAVRKESLVRTCVNGSSYYTRVITYTTSSGGNVMLYLTSEHPGLESVLSRGSISCLIQHAWVT